MKSQSIWEEDGKDENYQWYRTRDTFNDLRTWADTTYYKNGMSEYLDKNFLEQLRNRDFFARIWELKVAEYLSLTGLTMVPTKGSGADFCIELDDGRKIWIEAVLATPSEGLKQFRESRFKAIGWCVNKCYFQPEYT